MHRVHPIHVQRHARPRAIRTTGDAAFGPRKAARRTEDVRSGAGETADAGHRVGRCVDVTECAERVGQRGRTEQIGCVGCARRIVVIQRDAKRLGFSTCHNGAVIIIAFGHLNVGARRFGFVAVERRVAGRTGDHFHIDGRIGGRATVWAGHCDGGACDAAENRWATGRRATHRVAPELLAEQRQRGELLAIGGLAQRLGQAELDGQLVAGWWAENWGKYVLYSYCSIIKLNDSFKSDFNEY